MTPSIFDQMKAEGLGNQIATCECGKQFWVYWYDIKAKKGTPPRMMNKCGPCYFRIHKT